MDGNGDENAHLYAVDVEAREPVARNLTPLDGVQVQFYRILRDEPDAVIVGHNGRDRRLLDLYKLSLVTGALTLHTGNPGDVCGWSVTLTAQVRARFHCHTDGGWAMTVPDGVGGWREVVRGTYGDNMRLLGYQTGLRYAWALSNRGRDKLALVRLDLRDGSEEPIYEHPSIDVAGGYVHETGWLRFAWALPACRSGAFSTPRCKPIWRPSCGARARPCAS